MAKAKDTGARGLRSIVEDIMLDIMFELPERANKDKGKFLVTGEVVRKEKSLFDTPPVPLAGSKSTPSASGRKKALIGPARGDGDTRARRLLAKLALPAREEDVIERRGSTASSSSRSALPPEAFSAHGSWPRRRARPASRASRRRRRRKDLRPP